MLASQGAAAQRFAFELWHTGKIVVLPGDTLKGHVKYDMQQDLVQYTADERTVEAYTARKVLFFEILDETTHYYRQFYALPFGNSNTGYKAPMFFELLEEGKMTLLSREGLEFRSTPSPYTFGTTTRQVIVYKYFFLKENGDIIEFNGNRHDLIDMMGKKGKEVEKFMKSNHLRVEDRADFVQIVGYYNSLETGS
jgi:hypothetical protein